MVYKGEKLGEPLRDHSLSQGFIVMIKHHDQIKLWRKGFVCLTLDVTSCYLRKSGQALKAGTGKQEQKRRRSAAYWLALHGFLSLLSQTTQDHLPRAGSSHDMLAPSPYLSPLKKILDRIAYWPISQRFPQLRSLFPDDQLC